MQCDKTSGALDLVTSIGKGLILLQQLVFVDDFCDIREAHLFAEPKNRGVLSAVMLELGHAVTVSSNPFCARSSWCITKHQCFPVEGQ